MVQTIVTAQTPHVKQIMEPWIGHWHGVLNWDTGQDSVQQVEMQLQILSLDSADCYSWNLVYGNAQMDNRPYLLKPVDAQRGHWVIDEGNGIMIDQYLIGNSFSSAFEVQGNIIVDEFELMGQSMFVRFYSFSNTPVRTSGHETAESPRVNAYPVLSLQKVELRRQQ